MDQLAKELPLIAQSHLEYLENLIEYAQLQHEDQRLDAQYCQGDTQLLCVRRELGTVHVVQLPQVGSASICDGNSRAQGSIFSRSILWS